MSPVRIRPDMAVYVAILMFYSCTMTSSTIVFSLVSSDVVVVRSNLYTLCLALSAAISFRVFRLMVPEDAVIVVYHPAPETEK